jgi:prophage maintenance system killer protein
MYRNETVWKRAAVVHLHIVSQPQLFVEGNHRTGALLMSYLLVRKGKPPFVLTVDNAKSYFNPSASIGKSNRHSISMFFRMQKLANHFARLLKEQANLTYLL